MINSYQKFRNNCSIELYNRPESEINIQESMWLEEYIDDVIHPEWHKFYFNNNETSYEISNIGTVRNINTKREILPYADKDGYRRLAISINNIMKKFYVHRLVCLTFLPNPEGKSQVNHINANKGCNWYQNLEWCTARENFDHAVMMGLEDHIGLKGEQNIHAIYSNEQIHKVCKLLEENRYRPIEIAKKSGVSTSVIYAIRKGIGWTDISKHYAIEYINMRYGLYNLQNVYKEDQIHKVCKMLEHGYHPSQIEKSTGVSNEVVRMIYNHKSWVGISSQYKFPEGGFKASSLSIKYSKDQLKKGCELLMDPYLTFMDISRQTGIKMDTVRNLYFKKQWTEICSNYDFPERKNKKREIILTMNKMGKNNSEIYDAIIKEFGPSDRRHTLCQITDTIRRYNRS